MRLINLNGWILLFTLIFTPQISMASTDTDKYKEKAVTAIKQLQGFQDLIPVDQRETFNNNLNYYLGEFHLAKARCDYANELKRRNPDIANYVSGKGVKGNEAYVPKTDSETRLIKNISGLPHNINKSYTPLYIKMTTFLDGLEGLANLGQKGKVEIKNSPVKTSATDLKIFLYDVRKDIRRGRFVACSQKMAHVLEKGGI